nr:sterol desaturase family protein [Synechococcus sp. PCC 7336]
MIEHSFGFYGIAFFGIILLRYFLAAGGTYLFFYSPFSQAFINCNRQHRVPSWQSIQRDIKLSVLSAGVFALAAAIVMSGYSWGITRLYSHSQQYGLWYLGVSYGSVLLLQDAYFYFTHRLFHHPSLFSWLHRGHHRSRYPTPWTSFAFDPLEAIVQSLFFIGIVFIVPLHFITFIAALTTMTVWAVLNHLGIDRLPLSFPHHWLGKWFIGPAHHSVHHLKYNVHYGLYFTFWDKLLGTQDSNYEKKLDGCQLSHQYTDLKKE